MHLRGTQFAVFVPANVYEPYSVPIHGPNLYSSDRGSKTNKNASKELDSEANGHSERWSPTISDDRSTNQRAPWDMNSLKTATQIAKAGTGEVGCVIRSCTFRPREQAFTKLITLCGRWAQSNKAVEVFNAMTEFRGVKPNTITYTALISACSLAKDWNTAMEVFHRMKTTAVYDRACRPNGVTYNKIINASENAAYYDFAIACYREMKGRKIETDRGVYCSVLNSCIKAKRLDEAYEVLNSMHAKGYAATVSNYAVMISYSGERRRWKIALELFLTMQQLEQNVDAECCHGLMRAFELSGLVDMACELLKSIWDESIEIEMKTYMSALRVFAPRGKWEEALKILKKVIISFDFVPQEAKKLVIEAARVSAKNDVIRKLEALFVGSDDEQAVDIESLM